MACQLPQLRAADRDDRQQQRNDVIDDPVEHQRSENGIDADRTAERGDDDGLEHAQPGRDMAQYADADGDGVHGDECRPADVGLRQQHIQNRCRGGDVERRDQQLPQAGAGIRHPDGQWPEPQHMPFAAEENRNTEGDEDCRRDGPQQPGMQAHQRCDVAGDQQSGDGGDGRKPEAEGQRDESDDPGDILRRNVEPGIGAVANRSAAQGAETGRIADGIGAEGGQRHMRQRQLLADIP